MRIDDMLSPRVASTNVEAEVLTNRPKTERVVVSEKNLVSISENEIVISAVNEDVARQGRNYVRQLEIIFEGKLPVCSFEYYSPALKYRGFMIDVCRHFLTVKELKKIIDAMSLIGFNVFHWHLTDDQGWRFGVDGYDRLEQVASRRCKVYHNGELHEHRGFYTDDDLKEIVSFCAERGVTVIPEVDLPGHSTALIAAYPEFGCKGYQIEVETDFGIFPNVINPCSEKVWDFLRAMFSKLVSIFPGPYIHIGGDEVRGGYWEKNDECVRKMKELGIDNTHDFQGWFTSKLSHMVSEEFGKRAIGWDEVVEAKDIDKNVVVMSWRGVKGAEIASSRGHEVILVPNTEGFYLDYWYNENTYDEPGQLRIATIRKGFDFNLRMDTIPEDRKSLIVGAQCNLWTESVTNGRCAEYMLFPRVFAISENFWLGEKKDWDLFCRRRKNIAKLCFEMDLVCSPLKW